MVQQAINEYKSTMQQLLQVLSAFSVDQINRVPFKGSWTPGQVAEHLCKAQLGMPELFSGETISTNRPADKKRKAIANMFLNFSVKYQSPEFVIPSNDDKNKTLLINNLETLAKEVTEAADKYDETEECLNFAIPGFGPFTRLEWVYFITYHMQRHVYQLNNIYQKMAA